VAPATSVPTTPAAAPAVPVAQTAAPSSATPVPLTRAAETVEHVLRLASARGVTHARLVLRPDELGSVDIHLRQTADGLAARVVATTPEAVQQLQQAAADLRRSLEQQGVNLIALDIGHSDHDRSAGRSGAGTGEQAGNGHGGQSASDAAAGDAEATDNKTLQLPNGVLVDVLA
jgi:flagellar hook-length control protein FliK